MNYYQSIEHCISFFEPLDKGFIDTYRQFIEKEWQSINGRKRRVFYEDILTQRSKLYIPDNIATVSCGEALHDIEQDRLGDQLKGLGPWRKGPFKLNGVTIDSEWRSDMKWDRLTPWIDPYLRNKTVCDIGCGSGYYMYRALYYDPQFILGVDPSLLFNFQFHTVLHFAQTSKLAYLQKRLEDISVFNGTFDTVICMGVLYHRRDVSVCLEQLKALLKPNGTLILETLVLEGEDDRVLVPEGRYAKMPNVHYIPTVSRLIDDINSAGFSTCEVIDVTRTTVTEQRPTDWSTPTSLESFLDPNDSKVTIEGYPSPVRAILKIEQN